MVSRCFSRVRRSIIKAFSVGSVSGGSGTMPFYWAVYGDGGFPANSSAEFVTAVFGDSVPDRLHCCAGYFAVGTALGGSTTAADGSGYRGIHHLTCPRAGSVSRYLVDTGIAGDRLRSEGHADARPLTANDTPAQRATNRRVELTLESAQP